MPQVGIPSQLKLTVASIRGRNKNSQREKRFLHMVETFKSHNPPIYLKKHLGTGGFADVYSAESDYDDVRDFAVKVLRPELLRVRKGKGINPQDEEMRIKDVKKRFRNESYIQWHLSQSLSPAVAKSVVRVFDHGEFDSKKEYRFIVMERMGCTLRDFMVRYNKSKSPELLVFKAFLITRIAEIISRVHGEGVFHRDIKPENILFSEKKPSFSSITHEKDHVKAIGSIGVKLADFGTVRWVTSGSDQHDGVIIGSRYYLSPEQVLSPKDLDTRTDIYSFGVVAYELLHGIHPKTNTTSETVQLDKIITAPPLKRDAPLGYEKLNEIIMNCMRDLTARYQTMDHVVADLHHFCSALEPVAESDQ